MRKMGIKGLIALLILSLCPFTLPNANTPVAGATGTLPSQNDGMTNSYTDFIGVNFVNSNYYFGIEDPLVEGARRIRELGSKAIKLHVHPKYKSLYRFNSWPTTNYTSPLQLVQSSSFQAVLGMDFNTIVLQTFLFNDLSSHYWNRPYTASDKQLEYDSIYDLAYYLLTNYADTNKTFIITNWEGDNSILGPTPTEPTQTQIDDFIERINNRQDAVEQARIDAGEDNVHVYNSLEVNMVEKAMNDISLTITNDVIPYTYADFYSYSAYDTPYQGGSKFANAVDYLQSVIATNQGGMRGLYIGEFGLREDYWGAATVGEVLDNVVSVARSKHLSHVFYWELYCDGIHDPNNIPPYPFKSDSDSMGFWLIKPSGAKSIMWYHLYKLIHGADDKPSGDLTVGKTVTASSTAGAAYSAQNGVDGIGSATDPQNAWASGENQDVGAWYKVDLGQTTAIGDVRLQFRKGTDNAFSVVPQTITFQVSNDGANWSTIISRSNHMPVEGAAYSEQMYTYPVDASGRYLRLLFEDGTQNATYKFVEFTELEVYSSNNLALNKTASASSTDSAGAAASEGNDGIHPADDSGNFWATAANQDVGSWWRVDLGSTTDIGRVKIQFRNRTGLFFAIPKNITFQVSSDGTTWTTAVSKSVNVPVEGAAYSANPYTYSVNATGRYLRLLFEDGSQNTVYKYIELTEVGVNSANIAPGKTVSASSTASASYPASKGNDGVYSTTDASNAWASAENQDVRSWWKIDLGQTTAIKYVNLQFRNGSGYFICVPKNITFQISNNGTDWSDVILKSKDVPVEGASYSAGLYTYYFDASARYIRLLFEDGTQSNPYKFTEFAEFEVHK